jgi:ABC-type transporter lipoprotein component MlaA
MKYAEVEWGSYSFNVRVIERENSKDTKVAQGMHARDESDPKMNEELYSFLTTVASNKDIEGVIIHPVAASFIDYVNKQNKFKVYNTLEELNAVVNKEE